MGFVPRAVSRRRRTVCRPKRLSSIAHTATVQAGSAGTTAWRRARKVSRNARTASAFFFMRGTRDFERRTELVAHKFVGRLVGEGDAKGGLDPLADGVGGKALRLLQGLLEL